MNGQDRRAAATLDLTSLDPESGSLRMKPGTTRGFSNIGAAGVMAHSRN
jgi:hypothetical protein